METLQETDSASLLQPAKNIVDRMRFDTPEDMHDLEPPNGLARTS